jgi:hypothetical protein
LLLLPEIHPFPFFFSQTHEGWYPLTAIESASFLHKLRRAPGLSSRLGALLAANAEQEQMWYRKLFSVRLLFLLLVFFQVRYTGFSSIWERLLFGQLQQGLRFSSIWERLLFGQLQQ